MKKLIFILVFGLIVSCGSHESYVEPEYVDTSLQVVEELDEVSDIVQDFLSVDSAIFADEYCYDKAAIATAFSDESATNDWKIYKIEPERRYLEVDNASCATTVEFKVFERRGKKVGFLCRMDDKTTSFFYLEYDDNLLKWEIKNELPEVNSVDFFEQLTSKEVEAVSKCGVFGIHLFDSGDRVVCRYYDWKFIKQARGTKHEEFKKSPDYEIQILWDDENFWTEKVLLDQ